MLSNRGHRLLILHPRFFKAKRPYGLVFVASFNDNNGSGQKKKRKKQAIVATKMSPSFVSCTFQNNTINAEFIQGSVLKNTTWCHNYIVIFCSLKGPSCCDCHMPLAIEMCFSCFSSHWMSNISYWGSQIHLMISPPHSNGNGACDKTVVLT